MQQNGATQNYRKPLTVLTSLFFMWGLITSLNDILIPHLKSVFSLSYVQATLIQFCFFTAYFVVSYPAGSLVQKQGYKRGIMIGLATAAIGCVLFYPAAQFQSYAFFLGALFVMASGITILQVAANPYVTVLGAPETASSRLNLTQAFNSLGTTVGPLLGSVLILSAVTSTSHNPATEATSVQLPYLGLAAVLILLAVVIGAFKLPTIKEDEPADTRAGDHHGQRSIWSFKHLVLGAVGIFAYVGAEVSIGSFLVNLMGQPGIAGLRPEEAGKYLSLYWGGAMVGRFIGSAVMRSIKASHVLTFNAIIISLLIISAIVNGGHIAMWSLIAIGLFNSVMFPTIFSLALDSLGKYTSAGSGVLCMAIVGGAIMPVFQAFLADHIGLLISFIVPLVCYLYIMYYGFKGHRPQTVEADSKLVHKNA